MAGNKPKILWLSDPLVLSRTSSCLGLTKRCELLENPAEGCRNKKNMCQSWTKQKICQVVWCPPLSDHRRCWSLFTMKRDLDTIVTQQIRKESTYSECKGKKVERKAVPNSRVYEAKCIFCNIPNKNIKRQRTKETLTQCCNMRDLKTRQAEIKQNRRARYSSLQGTGSG